jgi:hypothetical protein
VKIAPVAVAAAVVVAVVAGCAGGPEGHEVGSAFAVDVVSFTPGDGAGFGADLMPDVVLGPPKAKDNGPGTAPTPSVDVLSLGKGGVIVLQMGTDLVDDDGIDLIVFENPVPKIDDPSVAAFPEPAQVSVSVDGADFVDFPCFPDDAPPNGCAGYGPVRAGDAATAVDPNKAGGDAFDLATICVARASFVKITDVGAGGPAPKAGFDLDAVAATH